MPASDAFLEQIFVILKAMPFKLIVFDLDFTIWNAGGTWCDHTCPPYEKADDVIIDNHNARIRLYPDVIEILNNLKEQGFWLGLASRTFEPSWANQLLELFDIAHFFAYKEIYPGPKSEHFSQLKNKSGIEFSEMIFFDDEQRNLEDIEMLGVKVALVKNGISVPLINQYIY